MISRRNIRVKVMQSLYSLESITEIKAGDPQKLLFKQFALSRQLFVYLTYFLTEVARYAEKDAHKKSSKHLPSEKDLNIQVKIAGNELIWKIIENKSFIDACKETKPEQLIDENLVKKIYGQLVDSESYSEYNSIQERERKSEKDIIQYIFTHLMLPNEDFISHVEDFFINWDDDGEMMNLLMQNFIQKPHQLNFSEMVSREKMDFAISLLNTTIEKKEVSMELLKPKLKNWDADRIASLDLIIIQLGIVEFLFFETIPTRVTINEYIDLAKEYSTPQSGQFINGILDNILKELSATNKIQKKTFKNSTL